MNLIVNHRTSTLLLVAMSASLCACGPREEDKKDPPIDQVDMTDVVDMDGDQPDMPEADAGVDMPGDAELVYPELDTTLDATAREVSALASQNACLTNSDCERGTFCFGGFCGKQCDASDPCESGTMCSDRGRCVVLDPNAVMGALPQGAGTPLDDQAAASIAVLSTYQRTDTSETRPVIAPGQAMQDFTVTFDRDLPDEDLLYRVQRSDADELVSSDVLSVRPSGDTLTFSVPTGDADPASQEARRVNVVVTAATGTYRFTMVPKRPTQGRYQGRAILNALGSDGIPIEFTLYTEPVDADLDVAQRVWMSMPVDRAHLFSPFAPGGGSDYAVQELELDSFTGKWVARFEHAYDLSSDSAQGVVAGTARTEQVLRSLRLELDPAGPGEIRGEIKDYWTGLYESRSSAGNPMLPDVFFEGTLEMERVAAVQGAAPAQNNEPVANPQLFDAPPLDACQASAFAATYTTQGGQIYSCGTITDSVTFAAATDVERAECALAVGRTALSGQTTIEALKAFLNGEAQTPGNLSFADYMRKCATKEDGFCEPAPEIACSRQLSAHAYRDQIAGSPYTEELADTYIDTTRELTLGNQLAAFFNDSAVRLEWLQTSTYPAVVTSEVRDLNTMLLDEWKTQVLDVHIGVLQTQFDLSGLSVLARETSSANAQAARESLLISVNQSWRGAIDSLDLSARRWDALYQDARDREDASRFVSSRLLGLYLSAGILKNINLSANAGYLSGALVGGFAVLQERIARLELPFSQLIYARDAEVVVSRSLDPTVGNDQLLGELETQARQSVASALTRVQMVVDREQAELLDETQLRNRINNEIGDVRRDLIELCGMPRGCSASDIDDPACRVRTQLGTCGLVYDMSGELVETDYDEFGVSEAGQQMISFLAAGRDVKVANADLQALGQRLLLQDKEIEAFGKDIASWNQKRQSAYDALETNIASRQELRSDFLAQVSTSYAMIAAERKAALDRTRTAYDDWNEGRKADAARNIAVISTAFGLRTGASVVELAANTMADGLEAAIEYCPDSALDPSFPAQGIFATTAATIRAVAGNVALGLNIAADSTELANEINNLNGEVSDLKALDDLTYDNMASQALVDSIEDELLQQQAMTQAEIDALAEIAELLRASMELELAYERDLASLREKRNDYKQMLTELSGLALRQGQAKQGLVQAMFSYDRVAQRAQLMDARLTELLNQRADVNSIVGSPAAFFGRTNRLTQAENTMEKARGELFEWLVALEYYAVRPFMDERLQILLARNPYQLEEIADKLKQIQSRCGGAVNTQTSQFSVRRDGLSILGANLDPVTMQTLSSEERFREILESGTISIDRRVRYSSDENVGNLISRSQDILTASFRVSLDDFANLGQTCNAKVKSIKVKLVGQGLGDARPVVSLLYDGTSYLRSCQPGLDDYVELFGPEATDFGSTTYLQAPGRSISPVAGINAFPVDANTSLGGMPLATQYTVLIDTQAGENGDIDWSQLEDIELELETSYQDFFPAGQCE